MQALAPPTCPIIFDSRVAGRSRHRVRRERPNHPEMLDSCGVVEGSPKLPRYDFEELTPA
jgi:hypothetical protein